MHCINRSWVRSSTWHDLRYYAVLLHMSYVNCSSWEVHVPFWAVIYVVRMCWKIVRSNASYRLLLIGCRRGFYANYIAHKLTTAVIKSTWHVVLNTTKGGGTLSGRLNIITCTEVPLNIQLYYTKLSALASTI